MKRFWLVLLSLGLIMAFSASAFAVDVRVSGEFYVAGLYLNKTALMIKAVLSLCRIKALSLITSFVTSFVMKLNLKCVQNGWN